MLEAATVEAPQPAPVRLPLHWRVLSETFGVSDRLLIEARWLPFDESADSYGPAYLTSILSCAIDYDHNDVSVWDWHTERGSAVDDLTFDLLDRDVAAWATYNLPRSKFTTYCADRMLKAEAGTWDRARDVIASLEAEIAAKRSGIPLCPICGRPAHASETDDLDRHPECVARGAA